MSGRGLHHGALIALALAGCEASRPGPFVEHDAWEPVARDADPLASHRPADAACPITEYRIEDEALEVQTGVCTYFAVEQPSLKQVRAGGTVHLVLWHSTLDDVEPGEAHVALLFGETVAWETTTDIPSRPRVHDVEFEAPEDVAVGDRVSLHLHNHGDNAWTFLTVELPD